MEKITVKDVKKMLPIGARIKITSKRALALPGRMFNAVKSFYNNTKNKLESNVPEEVKNEMLEKKLSKIDNKIDGLKGLAGQMEKQEEFKTGNKKYYLEAVEEEIEKLSEKRIKRQNKGLGKFALAKITLTTYLKNKHEKAKLKRTLKQQDKLLKEEEEIKNTLKEIEKEKAERHAKIATIIRANPELAEYYKYLTDEKEESKGKSK